MNIPFTKAHGARNDFLLTWRDQLPQGLGDIAGCAVAICDRHSGVGADGWLLMSRGTAGTQDAAIELWNSDGSRSEISGNGTRCAAALLVDAMAAESHSANIQVRIGTGAGLKHLRLLARDGRQFTFEMNMGAASIEELRASIEERDCTVVNVGNPQCVFFVENFDFAWQDLGARVERHSRFPNRTNVSFVRVVAGAAVSEHGVAGYTLDVRFFERGAGETMSSGTGSTGAAAAAVARGLVESPVRVMTPAGPLALRWEDQSIFLAGPAELIGRGEFFWKGTDSK